MKQFATEAWIRQTLLRGLVIPAHPLALDATRRIDERRQRALARYYVSAGAGGLAVGVHTTQFQIHHPESGLLPAVWALAAEEMDRADAQRDLPLVRVAGICGNTVRAVTEATLARDLGYHAGLVSLASFGRAPVADLLEHCRAVADVIPVFGFYLQPKAGGIDLPVEFWRGLCEVERVVAIKVAAFDRYKTLDVVRAVAQSGRNDIALYTGNDDNIVFDLVSPFTFSDVRVHEQRFVGGLLGQWAMWTSRAAELHQHCRELAESGGSLTTDILRTAVRLTDANSAIFDAANEFRGCIPGIHEVLRRQGLLAGTWCLDEKESLSTGQVAEIERVCGAYPELQDDAFVQQHLDEWLSG